MVKGENSNKLKLVVPQTFKIDIKKIKFVGRLPEKYIIKKDATVLFWRNGEKTVIKRNKNDKHNPKLAFLIAFFQYYSGLTKHASNKFLNNLSEEDITDNNIDIAGIRNIFYTEAKKLTAELTRLKNTKAVCIDISNIEKYYKAYLNYENDKARLEGKIDMLQMLMQRLENEGVI